VIRDDDVVVEARHAEKKEKNKMASKKAMAKTSTGVPAYIQDPDCTEAQIAAGDDNWLPFEKVRANHSLAIRVVDAELAKLVVERRRVRQLAEALGVPERVSEVLDIGSRVVKRAS
jgi:hypothetical protein